MMARGIESDDPRSGLPLKPWGSRRTAQRAVPTLARLRRGVRSPQNGPESCDDPPSNQKMRCAPPGSFAPGAGLKSSPLPPASCPARAERVSSRISEPIDRNTGNRLSPPMSALDPEAIGSHKTFCPAPSFAGVAGPPSGWQIQAVGLASANHSAAETYSVIHPPRVAFLLLAAFRDPPGPRLPLGRGDALSGDTPGQDPCRRDPSGTTAAGRCESFGANACRASRRSPRKRGRLVEQPRWNLGPAGTDRRGRPRLEGVLLKFPNNYGIHANLGTACHMLGRYAEAEQEIRRDLEINPEAHFGLEKYHLALLQYLAKPKDYQARHVYVDEWSLRSMGGHSNRDSLPIRDGHKVNRERRSNSGGENKFNCDSTQYRRGAFGEPGRAASGLRWRLPSGIPRPLEFDQGPEARGRGRLHGQPESARTRLLRRRRACGPAKE